MGTIGPIKEVFHLRLNETITASLCLHVYLLRLKDSSFLCRAEGFYFKILEAIFTDGITSEI